MYNIKGGVTLTTNDLYASIKINFILLIRMNTRNLHPKCVKPCGTPVPAFVYPLNVLFCSNKKLRGYTKDNRTKKKKKK